MKGKTLTFEWVNKWKTALWHFEDLILSSWNNLCLKEKKKKKIHFGKSLSLSQTALQPLKGKLTHKSKIHFYPHTCCATLCLFFFLFFFLRAEKSKTWRIQSPRQVKRASVTSPAPSWEVSTPSGCTKKVESSEERPLFKTGVNRKKAHYEIYKLQRYKEELSITPPTGEHVWIPGQTVSATESTYILSLSRIKKKTELQGKMKTLLPIILSNADRLGSWMPKYINRTL